VRRVHRQRAGLSWGLALAPGASLTTSHLTTFSPLGQVPLSTAKTADADETPAGGENAYTITVSNPNVAEVALDSITDELPAGFAYVPGSTGGMTDADPRISEGTLTWDGPLSVPARGTASLRFRVTVATTPGEYRNNASAAAEGYTIAPTGPTAPMTVVPASQNRPPDAADNTLTTSEDTPGDVNVLANDFDPDEDVLVVSGSSDGAHGLVACMAAGACVYTPAANHSGPDSFTYTISDGRGGTDTATVHVTVTPVNDAPDAVDDDLTTNQNTAGSLDVLANDTDPENDDLDVTTLAPAAAHGTVVCVPVGICTYTPAPGFNGNDSFNYGITDGDETSDATVAVTVNAARPPPPPPPPPVATLASSVSVSPADPRIGELVTYTIRVDNRSPVVANGVTVVHEAPGSATFVSAEASQGSCSGATTIVCSWARSTRRRGRADRGTRTRAR
jgi:uncharacterized repeat protein (TIGR01451 family)